MFDAKAIGAGVIIAWGALVGATIVSSSLEGCTNGARDVRCSNGGECAKADPKYTYCVAGRCVECVTSSGCGEHRTCHEGECV